MRPRVLFLNQYFPPDAAPTGVLLQELGGHLATLGWETEYVAAGESYRGSKRGSRALRELRALGVMLRRGLKARRPDVVFSGTSPPCLPVVAAIIAKWHRAKAVHWAMDIYPELALALGEIREGVVATITRKLMHWAYRGHRLLVALDDDMADRLRGHGVSTEVIAPWVLAPLLESKGDSDPAQDLQWIYSGNLGRAHEWETLLQVQALLERGNSTWRLVFQGGGPSWPKAQQRAMELGLRNCEWKPYAAENELRDLLSHARVLVVTQRPETQGLLWPSKLALLLDLGRPILWVGPTESAIGRRLRRIPNAGIFAPGQSEEIATWLENASTMTALPAPTRGNAGAVRAESMARWVSLLQGAAAK